MNNNVSNKISLYDLDEGFPALLAKARAGTCCLPNCNEPSDLVVHSPEIPPYLCYKHLRDGSDTHYGSWVPTANPYYEKWDCCGTNWKLCSCTALRGKFTSDLNIPTTEDQICRATVEKARLLAEQEENERWARMVNAGQDEAFDR